MKWALVASTEQELGLWVLVDTGQLDVFGNPYFENQWIVKTVPAGTIVNIIVYDGVAEYDPPENTVLMQVADDLQIGDVVE